MDAAAPFSRALSVRSALPRELVGLDSDPLWAAMLTSVQNVVLGEIRAGRYPELADESQRSAWPLLLDRLGHDVRVRIGREIVDELSASTVDELWLTWMRVARAEPATQERIIDLLEVLGEVVDTQLSDRFGVRADDPRPDAPDGFSAPPAYPGWRPLPSAPRGHTPAPLGRRAGAFLIDRAIALLITTVASLLLVWPAVASASSTQGPCSGGFLVALAFIAVGAVSIAWFVVVAWMVGARGASPGKRLMRIEVTGFSSPGPIGFGRAMLRELILAAFAIGTAVTAWLPYASVFWDNAKQLRGWHDKAVDDIVVEAARL